MEELATIDALRARLAASRARGRPVGLVATMGALHAGHAALVADVRRHAVLVVMSSFVNPLQFGPTDDFERYPRDPDRDRDVAAAAGVDILFAPTAGEMYRPGTTVRVVAGEAASRWEGAIRPGHFDGVLTVVAKLFNIVQPDVTAFGQKDIQQVTLIRRMIAELDFPVELRVVPIVRDTDGLAMSSRNRYLNPAERRAALALPNALRAVVRAWEQGETDAARLAAVAEALLRGESAISVDYVAVVDANAMAPVPEATAGTIVAAAIRSGSARLIDNVILGERRP
ncbi:MAG: pantoate--beta-alanine ligase [Gemmatimonadales bacterium]